ncbi:hypothetical protein JMJ35_006004 [Cladonia borealis]|uniref:FAD dependent oxidoreductase domain-containing protein n=1 Tax=Cladonia borealis TaxID=184061 RepID=A0AA39R112_9LECA|nr:hypothetical protein JMJ35_006004 [Cladonia borealis]
MPPPTPQKHVVVIGAGITGLQTALALQASNYLVTIIAEHVPGDEHPLYTSPWAGAQWRSHAKEHELEEQGWDGESYREWMGVVETGEGGRGGLGIVPSTLYWSQETPPTEWWHTTVQSLGPVPLSSLPPGTRSGLTFTAICIDVPTHLISLLRQFQDAGGKLVKSQLPTEQGLGGTLRAATELLRDGEGGEGNAGVEVDVWVNATGLSAKWVCGDESMYPIKGQTVLVKGEAKGARTWVDADLYVIPRPGSGTTILGDEGGGKLGHEELLNEEGEFEMLSAQSGLRPGRQRGARVAKETVERRFKVVHSYGHAGAGYQNAVGCARKVVELVKELEEVSL